LEHPPALGLEEEADAAAIRRALPANEPEALERVELRRDAGRRDVLALRELARGDAGPLLDRGEEARLAARDAEGVALAPEPPCEPEQHGGEVVREGARVVNHLNH